MKQGFECTFYYIISASSADGTTTRPPSVLRTPAKRDGLWLI